VHRAPRPGIKGGTPVSYAHLQKMNNHERTGTGEHHAEMKKMDREKKIFNCAGDLETTSAFFAFSAFRSRISQAGPKVTPISLMSHLFLIQYSLAQFQIL